jgi:hypothetical protein
MNDCDPTWGELQFYRADGSSVKLSEWAGRPVLLIFLRHLA